MDPTLDLQLLASGSALAAAISAASYATRSLSLGGALGAFAVGTAVFGLGGPLWGILLVVFFVTSSALSAWQRGAKEAAAPELERGSRRDLTQVAANGTVPAILAILQAAYPGVDLLPAFVGAVAAITADTWATEVGLTSVEPPHLITTGQPVPPGTSGGVTILGSAAAAGAGMTIGLGTALLVLLESVALYRMPDLSGAPYLLLAPVAAVAGASADSWLGATVQEVRRCAACGVDTERRVHSCGAATIHVRGRRFATNDVVNFAASAFGAIVALVLYRAVWG
jgi:uncharacterized protein (TIGR00297 family)